MARPPGAGSPTAYPVALLTLAIAAAVVVSRAHFTGGFVDFRAFYCGGAVAATGADPYLVHPLLECERRFPAPGLSPMHYGVTVPVPFPGFVLALFALVSQLPFSLALIAWEGAACAALGIAIVLVARATRTPVLAVAVVLGFPAVVVALQLGQLTPFIVLSVAATATALEARRPRTAACAALAAFLDPHAGLALALGVFVAVPAARATLAAGTAALLGIGVLFSGPAREWEYLHAVLPAHALANLADAGQYSATNLAFEFGSTPHLALALGSVWYAVAVALGIVVAVRLRGRLGAAAIAYVPTAFAVFGGAHTHFQQLALAIPAFLLVTTALTGWRRDAAVAVTFIAAMPWLAASPVPWLYVPLLLCAVVFARRMDASAHVLRLTAASFCTLGLILIAILRTHVVREIAPQRIAGNPLAELPWQAFTIARNVPTEAWYLIAKLPTVIAFLVLLAVLARTAFRAPAVVPEC